MSTPQQIEFTDRELQLIGLEIADKKSSDAAEIVGISYRTVTTHWAHMHERTGLRNRSAIVAYILDHELRHRMELLMQALEENV